MADSYYARRSARDPEWHAAQLAGAAERERQRREADPEAVRLARRLATRRSRARQRAQGFTFHELLQRVGGDRETLVLVLRDEVAPGLIDFHSTSRRYVLNGGLPADVRQALSQLAPPEPSSQPPSGRRSSGAESFRSTIRHPATDPPPDGLDGGVPHGMTS